jgi:thiol-disulfide isomerase/thioredoxin
LIAQHYGHGTPDLTPSLLTMDHKPATIQPVRGKWTLLYFWATWCGPCISEGIPELIAFTNDHKNSSSAFRIVAIHEKSKGENSTWREFHDKTVLLQHERWHVMSLPFDVLYDESSRLTSAWGVVAFPTYALIDPDGNLVPQGNLKTLAEKLRQ